MDKESLQKRLADLTQACEQSAGQHNFIAGQLAEVKYQLQALESKSEEVFVAENEVIEAQVLNG